MASHADKRSCLTAATPLHAINYPQMAPTSQMSLLNGPMRARKAIAEGYKFGKPTVTPPSLQAPAAAVAMPLTPPNSQRASVGVPARAQRAPVARRRPPPPANQATLHQFFVPSDPATSTVSCLGKRRCADSDSDDDASGGPYNMVGCNDMY